MSPVFRLFQKAVVKKLQKHYARPEGVPLMENGPEFKIEVSILKDVATVMIDTTGSSLLNVAIVRKKGERLSRENMAAAILQLSNLVSRQAFWLIRPVVQELSVSRRL